MNPTKFPIIYPSYLDSTKTIKQGRRIGKEEAVPVPTVSDISLALQTMKIRHVLQPYKGYSRDIETVWENPGRVKVDLTSHYPTKRELLVELAKVIPTLPERQKRLEEEAKENLIRSEEEEKERKESIVKAQQQQQQMQQQLQLQQQQSTKSTTNKSSTNNKKTGKKKR